MPLFRSFRPFSLPTRRALWTTGTVLSWTPVLIFFLDNFYQIMPVRGSSMYPFLNTDYNTTLQRNYVLVDMRRPWENLKRGSVIAFWSPINPEKMVVKRVVALEGDEVSTKCPPYPFPKETVPFGYVWVEGDNKDPHKIYDSNVYGPIAANLIVGQLKAIVWPWSAAGWISSKDYRGSPRVAENKHPVVKQSVFE